MESDVHWVTEEYGVLSLEEVEKARRHGPTPILLVGRDGETLSVGLGDFVRLTREYLVLGHYFRIGRYPKRDQKNASFVIEYSRSHSHSFIIG